MSNKIDSKHKIALISWCIDTPQPTHKKDKFLNLGEIYDENVKNDKDTLYSFHNNLMYLYPFKVDIINSNVFIHNIEDINTFRTLYKLTTYIFLQNYKESNESKENKTFHSPKLYNITLMIPLFRDYTPNKIFKPISSTKKTFFVLFPYINPILRTKLIDNCLSIIKKYRNEYVFIVLRKGDNKGGNKGDNKGENIDKTQTLYIRSLLKLKTPRNKIFKCNSQNPEGDVIDAIKIISFLITGYTLNNVKIYICLSFNDILNVMNIIKQNREIIKQNLGCEHSSKNIQFLCDT